MFSFFNHQDISPRESWWTFIYYLFSQNTATSSEVSANLAGRKRGQRLHTLCWCPRCWSDRGPPGRHSSPHQTDQPASWPPSFPFSWTGRQQGEWGEAAVTSTPPARHQLLLNDLLASLATPGARSVTKYLVEFVPEHSHIRKCWSPENPSYVMLNPSQSIMIYHHSPFKKLY